MVMSVRTEGGWGRVIRAYKFLLRPTVRQEGALAGMLRDHCSLYNGALLERRDAYKHNSRTRIRYGHQSAQLKEIQAFDQERQGRWSFSSQQATLRRLDKAFTAFFRRVKTGEKPGFPRFKGAGHFDTVEFPRDGDGCRWDSTPQAPVTRVRFQGIGHIRVHQHRPVAGRVKTVSVKREGRRWYVVLTAEQATPDPLPFTEPFQRCRSRVRTAAAIADIRFGLYRALRKIRQDFRRATPRSTGARAAESVRLTVCWVGDRSPPGGRRTGVVTHGPAPR
ncbi:transposase [Streptomyces albireticuli]|uniref:Transposase n=1 Tax=Streptomyces albireticuli TaxID=1940 RepID=A0A1Z2LCC8_9ACTN|nr:transposase [Streptomyces albireticuli]